MQDGEARTVWECPWWRVEERTYTGPDGKQRKYYSAKRPKPDTVHMLGLTAAGEVPVLRQWRVPMQDYVWELPAGILDVDGESTEDAALRELEEETGFRAGRIHHLFTGTVSPGLTNELYRAYLCLELTRVHDGGGLDGERLEVRLVRFDELEEFVLAAAGRGELVDAKIQTHIALATRKLAGLGLQGIIIEGRQK
ncbi:NUDIX hydrolase [bacterium]|nr:NUDIX hydrolase [bacterium]